MRFSFNKIAEFLGVSLFSLGFEAGTVIMAVGVFIWGEPSEREANTEKSGARRRRERFLLHPMSLQTQLARRGSTLGISTCFSQFEVGFYP